LGFERGHHFIGKSCEWGKEMVIICQSFETNRAYGQEQIQFFGDKAKKIDSEHQKRIKNRNLNKEETLSTKSFPIK